MSASEKNNPLPDFDIVYKETHRHVFRMAWLYLRNTEDAEEVTQDVFVKVFGKLHTFNNQSAVSTWVYRITVNTCLDFLRKRKRQQTLARFVSLFKSDSERLSAEHIEHNSPERIMESAENAQILFKAIDTLPTNQKLAFILSKTEGLPHEKIAEVLNISLAAVESLLFRAKQNLRKELQKNINTNE